ncbi:MAG: tetratricopeptide repeat protein, partial [Cyclobacteriaceae bacterium]
MRYLLIIAVICIYGTSNVFGFSKSYPETDPEFEKIYRLIDSFHYDSAIRQSQKLIPSLNGDNKLGEANFNIAYAHERSGRPFRAIQYYYRAAGHYTSEACLSNTFENIGLIYKSFNQHDKAVYYFNKAVALQKEGSADRMKKLYSRSASLRRNDQTALALNDLLEAE